MLVYHTGNFVVVIILIKLEIKPCTYTTWASYEELIIISKVTVVHASLPSNQVWLLWEVKDKACCRSKDKALNISYVT